MNPHTEIDVSSLISSADKLREIERNLNAKIDAANKRLESIIKAPLNRDDFTFAVSKIIKYRATNFEAIMLDWFSRDRINFEFTRLSPNGEFPYSPLETVTRLGKGGDYELIAFCGIFGQQIMEFVGRMADQMEWPADAIPVADRPAMLEEVRAEIAGLVAQRDMVAQALGPRLS